VSDSEVRNMKDFKGKVAVVTGAANGIGRAIADVCAREGMRVVLADINKEDLARAESELAKAGATVLAVQTDVSKAEDVEELARRTYDAFGGVHLLFNNAGVMTTGTVWENTLSDWRWVLGVNLWGVIHGVRTFVPLMLGQGTEGHIVNTASMRGLSRASSNGVYCVSKHGVVALTETLYYELAQRDAEIKVSVLCPGAINTKIVDVPERRLIEHQNVPGERGMTSEDEETLRELRHGTRTGMSPQAVADKVFDAIRDEKFYIITQPETMVRVERRMRDILDERNPTLPV
jgi:NAD(P)-dependent dehydrogenase (short-subunit alcohol dehydrogenase family)